ncbi:hypothetical protein Unana1_08058 [Umbelopsis nana]
MSAVVRSKVQPTTVVLGVMEKDDSHLVNDAPVITDQVMESVFVQIAMQDPSWVQMSNNLLAHEPESDIVVDAYKHLKHILQVSLDLDDRRCALGALSRPYYHAVAETLNKCHRRKGKFPNHMRSCPFDVLSIVNSSRILELEEAMKNAFLELDTSPPDTESILANVFLNVFRPNDMRIFLLLRTTPGSTSLDIMPPSFEECIDSFTRLHQVQPTSNRKGVKPSLLTVGGKAFSKHVHRDLKSEFWGSCNGNLNSAEKMKNETANIALAKIMNRPIWRNLHELPHNTLAYEIRHEKGYGARWTATIDNGRAIWMFRGFLEPPMEDGHSVGWVH